jgi:soluble cytochrome b562
MAFGGYAYEGYRDRTDELETKRLDVAKAYEDFKKNNPYATATELQSAINQIAGGNPYLRAAGGNRQAVDEVARRNREASLEAERKRMGQDMDFMDRRKKEIREQLYTGYLDTGNFGLAKDQVLKRLELDTPSSEYASLAMPELQNFVNNLDNNVENQFVRRYLDDNQESMTQVIENFGTYDDFATGLANKGIANAPAFRTAFTNQKSKFDEAKRAEMYQQVRTLASDPNAINMYRDGQLEMIMPELGRYANADPQIRTFINNAIQTQQQTLHTSTLSKSRTEAMTYAKGQSDAMSERMQSAINLDSYPQGVQDAIRAISTSYRPAGVGGISDVIAAAQQLVDEDDITYDDAVNKILQSAGGQLVPIADYESRLVDSYVSATGRPKAMTTASAYSKEMFGDSGNEGEIGVRVRESADRTAKVAQPTDDYLAGKMNKMQSRFGPQAYQAHMADIDAELARIDRDIQQINGAVAYGQNQANFLATFDGDFNAQMITANNASGETAKATLEQQKMMLLERRASVEGQLDLASRRVAGGLTNRDISDADIQRLAEEVRRMGGNAQSFSAPGRRVNPRSNQRPSNKMFDTIMDQAGLIRTTPLNRYGRPDGADAKAEEAELRRRIIEALQ